MSTPQGVLKFTCCMLQLFELRTLIFYKDNQKILATNLKILNK